MHSRNICFHHHAYGWESGAGLIWLCRITDGSCFQAPNLFICAFTMNDSITPVFLYFRLVTKEVIIPDPLTTHSHWTVAHQRPWIQSDPKDLLHSPSHPDIPPPGKSHHTRAATSPIHHPIPNQSSGTGPPPPNGPGTHTPSSNSPFTQTSLSTPHVT